MLCAMRMILTRGVGIKNARDFEGNTKGITSVSGMIRQLEWTCRSFTILSLNGMVILSHCSTDLYRFRATDNLYSFDPRAHEPMFIPKHLSLMSRSLSNVSHICFLLFLFCLIDLVSSFAFMFFLLNIQIFRIANMSCICCVVYSCFCSCGSLRNGSSAVAFLPQWPSF